MKSMGSLRRPPGRRRRWVAAAALLLALAAAPGVAAERTGTVDAVKADEALVVINDAVYRVAPGLRVRTPAGREIPWPRALRPGQHVHFAVAGERGGRRGTVTAIELRSRGADVSTE